MPGRIIPVFPLNIVLFPGMVLPLRIFEPRYRLMIRRCLESDREFGVVLIQDGEEVGTPAEAYMTGTIAEIGGHEIMPNGQIMLVCVGVRRFKILEQVTGEPYARALIEVLEEGDPESEIDTSLIEHATQTLEAYLSALSDLTNLSVAVPPEGLSPIDLSYLIAATLQVDNLEKQQLLECLEVEDRLKLVLVLLERENTEIQAVLNKNRSRGDFFYRGYRMSVN